MEEYVEDILEENESTLELLEALDFEGEYTDGQLTELFFEEGYFYHR